MMLIVSPWGRTVIIKLRIYSYANVLFSGSILSAGHEVISTDNGTKAWEILLNEKIDGMVVDIIVEGMHGDVLLERILGRPELLTIPIIVNSFMWGSSDNEDSQGQEKETRLDRARRKFKKDRRLNIITCRRKIGPGGGYEQSIKDLMENALRYPDSGVLNIQPTMTTIPGRLPKVLIVDDEQYFREEIKKALIQKGYETLEAINGLDAFDKLKSFHPDVIILDLIMPEMDGYKFIDEIKEKPEYQDIRIVVASTVGSQNVLGFVSPSEKKKKKMAMNKVQERSQEDKYFVNKPKKSILPSIFVAENSTIPAIVKKVEKVLKLEDSGKNNLSEGGISKCLILILEDDLKMQKSIVEEFQEAGHEVISTDNGTQALKLILERRPDGMVLDMEVKGMDGEVLLGRLASQPGFNTTPIFVLSSRYNFGRDFLDRPKPVDMAERVAEKSKGPWKNALNIINVSVKPGPLEFHLPTKLNWLRRYLEDAIKERKAYPGDTSSDSDTVQQRLPRVLIVENDARFREHLKVALEKEGHEIQTAIHGADAFEKLKSFYPDVITLDLMMPVMSGGEFLDRIRRIPEYQHIPIVVASSAGKPGMLGGRESGKKLKEKADEEIKARLQPNKKIVEKEKRWTLFAKDGSVPSVVKEVQNVLRNTDWKNNPEGPQKWGAV